jgi:hypothetical protein
MLLSYVLEGSRVLPDLCSTFIVLRLNAKALDYRPIEQDTTPNTTVLLVLSSTAKRNLFWGVGR